MKRRSLTALALVVLAANARAADPPEIPANIKAYLDAIAQPVKMTAAQRKAWNRSKAARIKSLDETIARLKPKAKTDPIIARRLSALEVERADRVAEKEPKNHVVLAWSELEKGDVGELIHPDAFSAPTIIRVEKDALRLRLERQDVWLVEVDTVGLITRDGFTRPTVAEVIGTKTYGTRTMPLLRVVDLSKYQPAAKAKKP